MGREFTPDEQKKVKQALAHVTPWSGLWYFVIPYRRLVVRENIRRVFGSFLSDAEQLKLARAFYSHFVQLARELFVEQYVSNWRKRFVPGILHLSHLTNALDKKKGALLLTAHTGNWEWGLIHAANNIAKETGSRTYVVSRVIRTRWLRRWRIRRLSRGGVTVIENKSGSLRKVIRALRENNVIVMTIDQHAGAAGSNAVWVPFFGDITPTFATLAELALRTGSPVLPSCAYRNYASRKHEMTFYEAIDTAHAVASCRNDDSKSDQVTALTALYNSALEQMIIEHPEQWLWSHRRWRD